MTSLTSAASTLDKANLANLHGELEAGRNPSWTLQDSATQALVPAGAADGEYLVNGSDGGAINALFNIGVRRVAAYRTVIVQIDTVTSSVNYVITITSAGGTTAYTHPSGVGATKQSISAGLAALISASADLIAYSEEDPTSGDYRLRIVGDQSGAQLNSDYTVDSWSVNAVVDGAELGVTGDANYCKAQFWGLPGGDVQNGQTAGIHQVTAFIGGLLGTEEYSAWRRVTPVSEPPAPPDTDLDGKFYVPFGGHQDRLDVRGLQRLHVQITDITGPGDTAALTLLTPRVLVGRCDRESTKTFGT